MLLSQDLEKQDRSGRYGQGAIRTLDASSKAWVFFTSRKFHILRRYRHWMCMALALQYFADNAFYRGFCCIVSNDLEYYGSSL
jgi:hypothetical protein